MSKLKTYTFNTIQEKDTAVKKYLQQPNVDSVKVVNSTQINVKYK